ncbi:MAG: PaaI family thioesterase [Stagnimonas sp.]|nr:PaaI family thioesterase [Stagnimonas sp.]
MSPLEQYLPMIVQHPLHQAMGVRQIDAADGKASLEVVVGAGMVNPAGMFHGGIVYTLCDMVCYAALVSQLQPGENAATHDLHVSILKAARLGETVRFEGRVLRAGRSVAFMEAVAMQGERLLARATVTKSILRVAA